MGEAPEPTDIVESPPPDPNASTRVVTRLPERPQLVGRRVGHYLLREHLCLGGMGDVYLAEHVHLYRPVAIKIPRTDDGEAIFNQRQLLAEARFLARVAHVNVVAVHDLGYGPEGLAYLVMEHLRGTSLDNVLGRTPYLALPDVLHVVREVARGLSACHRAGILVCDVKPENVMVVGGPLIGLPSQGTVWTKLIDLGAALNLPVAAESPEARRRSQRVGTPAYASPELIDGRALGPASDVYSLGVLLYELVAGCYPFLADSDEEHLRMHLEAAPTPLSAHRGEVPQGGPLERFLAQCLAKDPARRPEDMLAFLEGLDNVDREDAIGLSRGVVADEEVPAGRREVRDQASTVRVAERK